MRKLDHCNIVRLRYFFYSSGEKVRTKTRKMPPSNRLGQSELFQFIETRKSAKIVDLLMLRKHCSGTKQVGLEQIFFFTEVRWSMRSSVISVAEQNRFGYTLPLLEFN